MNNYTQDAMAMFDKDSDELFNFNYDENLFGDLSTKQAAGKIIKILNEKSQELQKCFVDYLERYLYREYKINKEDCLSFVLSKQKESKHLNGKSLLTPDRLKNIFVKSNFTPSRDYVFKLAFILGMQPEAVTELLQKGLRDRDFNFKNPLEIIYWYCLKHELGYSKVEDYLVQYTDLSVEEHTEDKYTVDVFSEYSPKLVTVASECEFLKILSEIKCLIGDKSDHTDEYHNYRLAAYFKDVYNEVFKILEKEKNINIVTIGKLVKEHGEYVKETLHKGCEDWSVSINPSSISAYLYSRHNGIEIAVLKSEAFNLPKVITENRLTDMKIDAILKGRKESKKDKTDNEALCKCTNISPSRHDYITLWFLQNYLDDYKYDSISDRLEDFCDSINQNLEVCGLQELNPNNPYEYFILLCMSTEDPLATFQEVFIQSIKKEQ